MSDDNTEAIEGFGQMLEEHYTVAAERYADKSEEYKYGATLIGAIREFVQSWDASLGEMLEGNNEDE